MCMTLCVNSYWVRKIESSSLTVILILVQGSGVILLPLIPDLHI